MRLGWYVFKDHSLVSATSRGMVNQLTGLAPFGMTFGTSGCDYHSIVEKKNEQIHFVKENLDQLEVELAVGKGHYVEQFASVMGCQKPDHFINTMKKSYVKLFNKGSINSNELLKNVKNTIKGILTFQRSARLSSLIPFLGFLFFFSFGTLQTGAETSSPQNHF